MKLTSKALGILIIVITFGGILASTALGYWRSAASKTPSTFTSGEASGMPNPADIRGSYSFLDIEKGFNIPSAELKKAFSISAEKDPAEIRVRDLESIYPDAAAQGIELGAGSMRLFVALYAGIPFEITGDIYLPASAVEMLHLHGNLKPDLSAYIDAHIFPPKEK